MPNFIKISLLILILVFNSCTVTQEFNFNEDFSGSAKFSFDIRHLKNYLYSIDSLSTSTLQLKDSIDWIFSQKAFQLNDIGLKNIEMGTSENTNVFYFSFEFDNIDELNKALIAPNNFSFLAPEWPIDTSQVYFTQKGKESLTYHGIVSNSRFTITQEMEAMKAYFVFKTIFNLKTPVKSTNNSSYIITNEGRKVEYRNFMLNIIDNKNNTDVILKFSER